MKALLSLLLQLVSVQNNNQFNNHRVDMSLCLNDNCGKVDTTFILQLKQINQFKEMRKLTLHHKASK